MPSPAVPAAVLLTVAVRAGVRLRSPKPLPKACFTPPSTVPTTSSIANAMRRRWPSTRVKAGQPIPSETVIAMVNLEAKLNAAGVPEKEPMAASWRPTKSPAAPVMEEHAGWGSEYPPTTCATTKPISGLLHLAQAARQAGLRILFDKMRTAK